MGYWIRISSYLKRIILFDLTHIMSMADLIAIDAKTLRIDSECSLEIEFIELVRMNLLIVLYLTVS